jgi:Protein involved in formate dehydrogenase formation
MQVLEAAIAERANPWPLRRERAAELAERYPHAAEMLRLYQALVLVQERAYLEARSVSPPLENLMVFAAERVLPEVIDATVASGPARLRDGVISVFCSADLPALIGRWLDNESLSPIETYLARASASPILEALSKTPSPTLPTRGREAAGLADRLCPSCGGLPQVSYFAVSGEALVTGPRYLVCSRCATNWIFSRMTCAGCGENDGTKLPILQDDKRLPHIRVDGCRTCHRYLLTIDLRRDARAVPVVDELAALPLDLYAMDQGLTKITPNLLGN